MTQALSEVHLPRIAIAFCTQCKWNLRAAYFAQELLQTFSTTLGEVSLIPVTGGIFTVTLYTQATSLSSQQVDSTDQPHAVQVQSKMIWDRKAEGGFPETKELKNRVRNVIEPDRDLGHIDRSLKKGKGDDGQELANTEEKLNSKEDAVPVTDVKRECEDCK